MAELLVYDCVTEPPFILAEQDASRTRDLANSHHRPNLSDRARPHFSKQHHHLGTKCSEYESVRMFQIQATMHNVALDFVQLN